jgi:hypothetical protein
MNRSTKFAHRHNSDGSYDSICFKCYATAATAGKEEALSSAESAHVCDPMALYRANQASIPVRIPMWRDRSQGHRNRRRIQTDPQPEIRMTVKAGRAAAGADKESERFIP